MANGYDGPSQITDLGGLPDKQGVEDLAAAGDVSLGKGGNEPSVSPGPARIAPANESLNLGGGVSEFIQNAQGPGNIASDKLKFGLGAGPSPMVLTEQQQQRASAVQRAMEVFEETSIPAVRKAAAEILKGAVHSDMQGDDDE